MTPTLSDVVSSLRPDGLKVTLGEQHWLVAAQHGVHFRLFQLVSGARSGKPEPGDDLKADVRDNLLNNLELVAALREILTCAAQHEVRMLCFKGPALALTAYGNLTQRGAGDLDLFVDSSDLETSISLLSGLGFVPEETLRGRNYRDFHFHIPMRRDDGVEVELHWAISRRSTLVPFSMEQLWSRRGQIRLENDTFAALSAEDHLLILCVHGARHLWERIIWVLDLDVLIRSTGSFDWDGLFAESHRLGCHRMLLLGLLLVRQLFATPLPARILQGCYRDPVAIRAAQRVVDAYGHSDEELPAFQRDLRCLQLRDRWRDKLQFFLSFPIREYRDLWAEELASERVGKQETAERNLRDRIRNYGKRLIVFWWS